jgi:crotonobetainyl-CoA:carnitine CoA-transferase CaiB-like acyl-CoA transferase
MQRLPSEPQSAIRTPRSDGGWIAIAVETDEQWRALCGVMGSPAWCADARFATMDGRWAHQDEIDEHLAAWTAGFEHHDLMRRLQAAGVPAGAVLSGMELLNDPQLRARGWWDEVTPPDIGRPFPFITMPWRMSDSPYRPSTSAPRLGEHNDLVYLDLLGLTSDEYARYHQAGIISTDPVWVRE